MATRSTAADCLRVPAFIRLVASDIRLRSATCRAGDCKEATTSPMMPHEKE
jgi:hypothetical protein